MGLHQMSDKTICKMNVVQILCLANVGHKCKKEHVAIKISVQLTKAGLLWNLTELMV